MDICAVQDEQLRDRRESMICRGLQSVRKPVIATLDICAFRYQQQCYVFMFCKNFKRVGPTRILRLLSRANVPVKISYDINDLTHEYSTIIVPGGTARLQQNALGKKGEDQMVKVDMPYVIDKNQSNYSSLTQVNATCQARELN